MGESRRYSIPRLYYLITPAFILLDYLVGVNVRVAVLDGLPLYKNLYYGFCAVCGLTVYLLPAVSAAVALFESTVNVAITMVSLFLPYVQSVQHWADLEGGGELPLTVGPEVPINLLLAGVVAVIAFKQTSEALSRQFSDATAGLHGRNGKGR
jgi:hypothetical protein